MSGRRELHEVEYDDQLYTRAYCAGYTAAMETPWWRRRKERQKIVDEMVAAWLVFDSLPYDDGAVSGG